jgi:hypothetical protein
VHVEAIGAAIDLRNPCLHERKQFWIEPAFVEIILHADQGGDAIRSDGVGVQSLRHGFISEIEKPRMSPCIVMMTDNEGNTLMIFWQWRVT